MGARPKTPCVDSRKCFAQKDTTMGFTECTILERGAGTPWPYVDGKCPFCKANKEWTNSEYYPLDRKYGIA